MTSVKEPDWQVFEVAVAAFLAALSPDARVRQDIKTPDLQTGRPRQRDVWIDIPFGGLFALTVLVSCKRKRRPLSQQDIDAFHGELANSGANKGVLYAYGGFTQPALEKARRLGIVCCRLYQNQAPDLPEHLPFKAYAFRERLHISFGATPPPDPPEIVELLDTEICDEDGAEGALIDVLAARFRKAGDAAMAEKARFAPIWSVGAAIDSPLDEREVRIVLASGWSVYRARAEAWLLNGSYAVTEGAFAGAFSTPWIDRENADPGPGWERIEAAEVDERSVRLVVFCYRGDTAGELRAHYRGLATAEAASS
jgi:hypothetical protein